MGRDLGHLRLEGVVHHVEAEAHQEEGCRIHLPVPAKAKNDQGRGREGAPAHENAA